MYSRLKEIFLLLDPVRTETFTHFTPDGTGYVRSWDCCRPRSLLHDKNILAGMALAHSKQTSGPKTPVSRGDWCGPVAARVMWNSVNWRRPSWLAEEPVMRDPPSCFPPPCSGFGLLFQRQNEEVTRCLK